MTIFRLKCEKSVFEIMWTQIVSNNSTIDFWYPWFILYQLDAFDFWYFFLLFYLVRFNSSFQKLTQLGLYYINIKITLLATSSSGREHKCVRTQRSGRENSGSNPRHDQQFL